MGLTFVQTPRTALVQLVHLTACQIHLKCGQTTWRVGRFLRLWEPRGLPRGWRPCDSRGLGNLPGRPEEAALPGAPNRCPANIQPSYLQWLLLLRHRHWLPSARVQRKFPALSLAGHPPKCFVVGHTDLLAPPCTYFLCSLPRPLRLQGSSPPGPETVLILRGILRPLGFPSAHLSSPSFLAPSLGHRDRPG